MDKPILHCTEEFLNNLIQNNIIEPRGDGVFMINTKPDLKGNIFQIQTTCSRVAASSNVEIDDNNSKSIDEWYTEIRNCFPTDINKELGIDEEGQNLRTGNKKKVVKRIKEHISEGYSLQAIVNAIKYEVWNRKKQSTPDENKLQFMRRMEAWLNDTNNMDTMIERSLASTEFQQFINNGEKEDKSTRKIRFA